MKKIVKKVVKRTWWKRLLDDSNLTQIDQSDPGLKHSGETKALESQINLTNEAVFFTTEHYVLSKCLKLRAKTVVDVGCGIGSLQRDLRCNMWGGNYLALDGQDFGLEIEGKRRSSKVAKFAQCDLRELPLRRGACDVIVCSEVIEHIEAYEGRDLVYALADALSSGGKLILTLPLWRAGLDMENELRVFGHKQYWRYAEFVALLEEVGLNCDEEYSGRMVGARQVNYASVKRAVRECYGEGGVALYDSFANLYHQRLAVSAFAYLHGSMEEATHYRAVWSKK